MAHRGDKTACTLHDRSEAGAEPDYSDCSATYHFLGTRWNLQIISALLNGYTRFTEIAQLLNLNSRTLAERLKHLELEGIVIRQVRNQIPVRIAYGLTAKGQALHEVLSEIQKWAVYADGPEAIEVIGEKNGGRCAERGILQIG
ncbi:winged helix-turn-helix transcriptional regulator [Paenibacillus oleatilyticus]|uniref:winged helix-turn-helix transcriptional regulator n=1 Tax=Paenibacillus oleatilyticus TaxID=2594886 RepID=UPI001C1F3F04|nr:winged helix-turn-helix transcriptional regulator [Paenibacillus oleatilyticus]MBU7314528.1 winged helix-turn-helix transcriptional regulator [Paenibacillus oleatilyticus]